MVFVDSKLQAVDGGGEGQGISAGLNLDLVMPGVDGPQVAHQLKEDLSTEDIPVVFLTTLINKEEAERKKMVFMFIHRSP